MIGLGTGLWAAARQGLGGDIAPPAPLLLIVAGQSNAGKQGTAGQTPPGKYADLGVLRIWDGGSAFVDYQVGSNPGDYPSAWGTEAEFVFQMRQAGDHRPVYLVKRVVGGTSVGAGGGTDWSPASTGELFDQLAARVAAARTAIASAEAALPIEITFWNQGENDIQNNGQAAAFAANMAAFLDGYRAEISAGLFILERTRPFPGWYSNSFAIRKAQLDTILADGNALAIDCDFEPGDFASLHPPPSWCEGIGLRAHAAWTGTYTGSFGAISDAVPEAFGFTDLTGQTVSSTVTSEAITPTGYERDTAIGVSGGEYRILNPDDAEAQGWGSAPGRVSKWQKVQVRLTSSAEGETATSLTLTIGGIATVWSVTTGAAGGGTADVSYLIVGGGGSGGRSGISSGAGGGGGGGAVLTGTQALDVGSYAITVGAGGEGGTNPQNGFSSAAFGFTAAGGGRGGSNAEPGQGGGQGGGGGSSTGAEGVQPGGTGTQFNGGAGFSGGAATRAGGGGGGASAAGANAASGQGGNGGEGLGLTISGSAVVYGSGGGGGVNAATDNGIGGTNAGTGGTSGPGRAPTARPIPAPVAVAIRTRTAPPGRAARALSSSPIRPAA